MTTARTNNQTIIKRGYFYFLCGTIASINPHYKNQEMLLTQLHLTPFKDIVPNDDNRAKDGMCLRERYSLDYHNDELYYERSVIEPDSCSLLEMMVALAIRIEYQMMENGKRDRTDYWFWTMVTNLGLERLDRDDPEYNLKHERNAQKIDAFMERRYGRKGHGGLFPMEKTVKDQRKVEIWYQMQEWIQEKYPE